MSVFTFMAACSRRRFSVFVFIGSLLLLHAPGSFSATVIDDVGRSVEIPDDPQRIVSLAPSVTEILFALNLGDKVVGVTQYSDFPAGALKKENIGTYVRPNIEKIVSLGPDLVIATADGNPKRVVEQMESLGLAVFTVFPKEIEDIYESIRAIGAVTGTTEKANALSRSLQAEMEEIAGRVKGLEKKKVFFQLGSSPLYTTGSGTFVDRLITLAGGINIAGGEPTRYPVYSMEAVIMGSPEVILSAVMGTDRLETEAFWGKWPVIPAVEKRQIFKVNPDLSNRPSPRIVEGLREIAMRIHPEAFGKGALK